MQQDIDVKELLAWWEEASRYLRPAAAQAKRGEFSQATGRFIPHRLSHRSLRGADERPSHPTSRETVDAAEEPEE